ncbi:MAG: DUF3048 domain-containing protein [Acidobacteriota bacterium]|jgi:uncharacterized protein YceK|nr:DUF3048 domain-containing protein [Acidobacteriota bacterium]
MSFKKVFPAVLVVTLALSGCSAVKNLLPSKESTNFLNGTNAKNGPVLVVKIDDTTQAHPQIGLEDADVVYIEQVEGGLTRLAAVFSSVIPQRIGPVRSARISDIDIVSQYGRVAFAYSGAQRKFLPVIEAANLEDLGAQHEGSSIYTTDPNRTPPYAMVLRADLLMKKISDKHLMIDTAKDIGFVFSDKNDGGVPTDKAVMHWPAATYSANWSESEKRWLLSHNNQPDIAESGVHLGPTTLVIQMVSITPSEYKDKLGGVTPLSHTIGSGKAYVLRNGELFAGSWNRTSAESGTTFAMPNGDPINFAAGQVWIALTDREPDFTSRPSNNSK